MTSNGQNNDVTIIAKMVKVAQKHAKNLFRSHPMILSQAIHTIYMYTVSYVTQKTLKPT
jgi:hypothetical protein